MFGKFDIQSIWYALPYLLQEGLAFTCKLTLIAGSCGLLLGMVIALMRLSSNPVLHALGTSYANVFRAIPIVLGIFSFYVLMPYVAAWVTGSPKPVEVGPYLSAYVSFTMFEAAYFSEVIRAGIQSIPSGQTNAAKALGMRYPQMMRHILLPQALRKMMPVLLTLFIILFQDTSLVYILSLPDMFGVAARFAQRDNRLVEMYVMVALVYFAISFTLSSAVKALSKWGAQ